MTAELEARQVSMKRGGRLILEDASIAVPHGVPTAIVGPNGSGKSTLLRILAGLWQPSSGEVTLDGIAIGKLPKKQIARRIAYMAQETRFDFAFTVEDIVAMGRFPHRGRFDREKGADRRAIGNALDSCDIAHLRARHAHTLSGGEKQRVAIARSLATEAEILLLDEPTANLDLEHSLGLLDLCRRLAGQGKAVVIAMHDLNAAARNAGAVVLLSAGRIVCSGLPEEVFTPAICREVFHVETEIIATQSGSRALVFDVSAQNSWRKN